MLADAKFPNHQLLDIAEQARDHIHSIEGILFWIAVPLALLPPIPITWKWIWIRTLVVTLVVWIAVLNFRIVYEVPWNRIVLDIEKKDWGYDGVGGNAVQLMVGWVFPFVQCFIPLCIIRIIATRMAARRNTNTEQARADQP